MRLKPSYERVAATSITEAARQRVLNSGGHVVNGPKVIRPNPEGGKDRGLWQTGNVLFVDPSYVKPDAQRAELYFNDLDIAQKKYGLDLRGLDYAYGENVCFQNQVSTDGYGSGVMVGGTRSAPPVNPGSIHLRNIWSDSAPTPGRVISAHPDPFNAKVNNEALTVELGNKPVRLQGATLFNGDESCIDAKSDVMVSHGVLHGGLRTIRSHHGARMTFYRSVFILDPAAGLFSGHWIRDGRDVAEFQYFECLFGFAGQAFNQLVDRPEKLPGFEQGRHTQRDSDTGEVEITALRSNPFSADPFFYDNFDLAIPPQLLRDVPYGEVNLWGSPASPPAPPPSPPPAPGVTREHRIGLAALALLEEMQKD